MDHDAAEKAINDHGQAVPESGPSPGTSRQECRRGEADTGTDHNDQQNTISQEPRRHGVDDRGQHFEGNGPGWFEVWIQSQTDSGRRWQHQQSESAYDRRILPRGGIPAFPHTIGGHRGAHQKREQIQWVQADNADIDHLPGREPGLEPGAICVLHNEAAEQEEKTHTKLPARQQIRNRVRRQMLHDDNERSNSAQAIKV